MTSEPIRTKLSITAVVLAGGRSLRMGTDKTMLPINSRPLIAHAVDAASAVCEKTIIVTNRPDELPMEFISPDVEIMVDEVAYQGPLGGLVTALPAAQTEWVFACAADMPWVSQQVIEALWDMHEGSDVVIPVGPSGPEPLLALYRVETVLPAARKVLDRGRRRIVAMFPELTVQEVSPESLREVDPELTSFFNINTQTDFAEALDRVKKRGEDGRGAPSHKKKATLSPEQEIAHKEKIKIDFKKRPHVKVMLAEEAGRKMPSETPITLFLNNVEVATVQATADHLEDMAVGFMVSEGLLKDRSKFIGVDLDAKRGSVFVTSREDIPDDLVHKTRYITSGCGKGVTFSSLGHARGLKPVTQEHTIHADDLYKWMGELASKSEEYRERGGSHSCGLVANGELLLVREDVGRHNAADKLVGHAWLEGIDMEHSLLLTSGRVSYEMMVKAAKHRIPVVASRSAATDLAVQIADELGITMVGYVRGGKVIVYSHPRRIISTEE